MFYSQKYYEGYAAARPSLQCYYVQQFFIDKGSSLRAQYNLPPTRRRANDGDARQPPPRQLPQEASTVYRYSDANGRSTYAFWHSRTRGMTGFIRAALFAGISDVQEHRRGASVQRANPLLGALWPNMAE